MGGAVALLLLGPSVFGLSQPQLLNHALSHPGTSAGIPNTPLADSRPASTGCVGPGASWNCPMAALVSSPAAPAFVRLSSGGSSSPPPRSEGAGAYDASSGNVLLFGGCGPVICPRGDTWTFRGGNWTNVTSTVGVSPSARFGASVTYDSSDREIVLFGGSNGATPLGDTWSFAGGLWSQLASGTSPSPRSFAAHAASATGLILFGGRSVYGANLSDTWEFSGGAWQNLTGSLPASPPARSLASIAYDTHTGKIVLFGGVGVCGNPCNDTWLFSAEGWTNVSTPAGPAPSVRSDAPSAFDPGLDSVVLFGGSDAGVALGDTWEFTGNFWVDLTGEITHAPPARSGASAAYDASDGYLLVAEGKETKGQYAGAWAFLTPLSVGVDHVPGVLPPDAAVTLNASVEGGMMPYRALWSFGDGATSSSGLSVQHAFASPGTYTVSLSVADARGSQASLTESVHVARAPLLTRLVASPAAVALGGKVTLLVNVTGGEPPYHLAWSLPVSTCRPEGPGTYSCWPNATGSFNASVSVVDASSAVATSSVVVTVNSQSLGPGPASHAAPSASTFPAGRWIAGGALVASLVLGTIAALMMWRYSRPKNPSAWSRLSCYALPAWAETPEEFTPEETTPLFPGSFRADEELNPIGSRLSNVAAVGRRRGGGSRRAVAPKVPGRFRDLAA
ncbi:MAG: kelch repeat-containing protein [Candidatus Lutacidiplasmatales archaeon]